MRGKSGESESVGRAKRSGGESSGEWSKWIRGEGGWGLEAEGCQFGRGTVGMQEKSKEDVGVKFQEAS